MSALALVGFLTASVTPAESQKVPVTGPLRFQEVVSVGRATRDQIYSAALVWFSQKFGGAKDGVDQNKLAGVLIGRGEEKYVPPFMAHACRGWRRYRVMLVAKDGRYFYNIDGFTHVGDRACQKRSFGLLTRDWLNATIHKTVLDFTLHPSARRDEYMETWLDLKQKATAVAEALATSLRGDLASAGARRPPA
jgi:Domain of unknown function (DUF4468) with TBP-like fold